MPVKDIQYHHISTWTLVRFFAIVLGFAFIFVVRDIIASLFFAVIIASAIEPAIEWLKTYRVPRILSVLFIFFVILAVLASIIYIIFPIVFEEVNTFFIQYPVLREGLRGELGFTQAFPLSSFFAENLEAIISGSAKYLEKLGGGIANFASIVFGGIFSFVLVVVFSVYLAAQEKGIENFLRLVVPIQHESYVLDLWVRSQRTLGRWFRAQLLLGAIVGVLIFFGLTFLGVEQALFLALLAAVFEIIPVVGPIFAAVPAVITGFLNTPLLGALTVVLYVLVQQVESNVIIPVVMRRAIGLSPLIVVLALLIGGKLGGILGLLLAVPVTAILAEILSDWDKKKRAFMPG